VYIPRSAGNRSIGAFPSDGIGRQSFSDAQAAERFEAHPAMTESSDLKASRRTILLMAARLGQPEKT
jgi:hypothetical protein